MRFFLSILGVIIFIVVVIVIIASSGSTKGSLKPINLTSYNNTSSSVTQINNGLVIADSQRAAIKVTVSQSQASIYILGGYNRTVLKSESFTNNATAYGVFLGALENANFTSGRITTQVNMFGVCPLGNTYQYQLNNGSKFVSNLWSTSCSNSDGTFNGDGPLIRQLFDLQIPNYNDFTNQTNLTNFFTN